MKKFMDLPEVLQAEVKEMLGAFDTCYVEFENSVYNVTTGITVKEDYADDHDIIKFEASEVLTEKERILAYANNFYDYSPLYKGKRDYKMLSQAKENKIPLCYDLDGNIILKKKVYIVTSYVYQGHAINYVSGINLEDAIKNYKELHKDEIKSVEEYTGGI